MKSVTSESYIVVHGKKRYLENDIFDLEDLIENSKNKWIKLQESTFVAYRTIRINKNLIEDYGEV